MFRHSLRNALFEAGYKTTADVLPISADDLSAGKVIQSDLVTESRRSMQLAHFIRRAQHQSSASAGHSPTVFGSAR